MIKYIQNTFIVDIHTASNMYIHLYLLESDTEGSRMPLYEIVKIYEVLVTDHNQQQVVVFLYQHEKNSLGGIYWNYALSEQQKISIFPL